MKVPEKKDFGSFLNTYKKGKKEACFLMGEYYFKNGDYAKADTFLKKALVYAKSEPQVFLGLYSISHEVKRKSIPGFGYLKKLNVKE